MSAHADTPAPSPSPSALTEALTRAAAETFEALAMVIAEPLLQVRPHAEPTVGAVVRFTGPTTGYLALRLPASALALVSQSMLGELDTPAPAQQQDALGELANVICGNVTPQIGDPRAIYHLAAPVAMPENGWPPVVANLVPRLVVTATLTLDLGHADLVLALA